MSNGKLTLKYELNVSHKTSSTLEVLSWFSQVSCQYITWQSWGKRGEEESLVIKFWFLKTAYKSENMSGPGSMSNSHLRGANKQPS